MASLQSTQVPLRNKQRWEMMGFRQEPRYTQTRSRSVKVNHAKGVKTKCQPGVPMGALSCRLSALLDLYSSNLNFIRENTSS